MKNRAALILFLLLLASKREDFVPAHAQAKASPFLLVLGVAQDAGLPQAGCERTCCAAAWRDPALRRSATALAIVDPLSHEWWLIEATPNFPEQLRALAETAPSAKLAGIFLTHAHIGHYTGLMHLGREAMGAKSVPVYAMPRMQKFLSTNGPWDQLVRLQNIALRSLQHDSTMALNERLRVTPLLVPHRDEYTETVGFRIAGPRHAALFIPDIDKWEKWPRRIEQEVARSSVAYLDGTFYGEGEVPGRSMAEIPHPTISETMARFINAAHDERNKVRFIHLNHTNPALQESSTAYQTLRDAGFRVARPGERFDL